MPSAPPLTPAPPARWLAAAWDSQWPGHRPVAHTLRTHPHWLRFHSLPGSKRYADNEAQYTELLGRHHTVLAELASHSDTLEILLITCSWSFDPEPKPRSLALQDATGPAAYWRSVPTDADDPEFSGWTHLFYQVVSLDEPRIEALLRLVADDVVAGVLLADPDLTWIYHPYDGGADLYPSTLAQRDELRCAHRAWLSPTATGL